MRLAMRLDTERPCEACRAHYGDDGPCDRGMPVALPHRPAIEAARAAEAQRIATYRAARRTTEVA